MSVTARPPEGNASSLGEDVAQRQEGGSEGVSARSHESGGSGGFWATAIVPDWPVPARVRALSTTRLGGVSSGAYAGLNLGTHVGDVPAAVAENRARLARAAGVPVAWMEQVHGIDVVDADAAICAVADAVVSRRPGVACAVMTADCLPVLFADRRGQVVGAAHAGWRGLAAGVLEATLGRMGVTPGEVCAWLGPAIGPSAFEVGDEVRTAFVAQDDRAAQAFHAAVAPGKWMADLFELARLRLTRAGVGSISGGGLCTHADAERFYSHRRDRVCGRMATLIWLDEGMA